MNRACFLDRDGVLIKDMHYIKDPDDVELMPGVADALKKLHDNGFLCVVVSNQSGVARGYFSEESVDVVNARICELLAERGEKLDASYYCPHYPDGDVDEYSFDCDCRKPGPGMFLKAAEEHSINLGESFMIGDKVSDIEAARKAGCKEAVMVKTGKGEEQFRRYKPENVHLAAGISEAVDYLLDS